MTKETKIDFDGSWQNYKMRNGIFSCGFNMPEALTGEGSNSLPPHAKRMSYLVDEYPSCPDSWMRSEGRMKSFFVPVEEDKGMWLDLNDNANLDRHVAIVVSIQGVNPITGLPCNNAQLEQYIDSCPKHNKKFGPDRYCKECGFKWPKQNYLATTGTPKGMFWLDGFKSAEGIVRQYILTAEKMRGVASNVIGADRVYAVGLSFFLAKEKKPEPKASTSPFRGITTYGGSNSAMGINYVNYVNYGEPQFFSSKIKTSENITTDIPNYDSTMCCFDQFAEIECSNSSVDNGITANAFYSAKKMCKSLGQPRSIAVQTKKLEVGAGAKINQVVSDDPEGLDFWHDEPESIICINYCVKKDAEAIIKQGKVELEVHEEGFLQNIPVGN